MRLLIIFLCLFSCFQVQLRGQTRDQIQAFSSPIRFVENKGQIKTLIDGQKVLFQAQGGGVQMYFTAQGIHYYWLTSSSETEQVKPSTPQFHLVRMQWLGANPEVEILAEEPDHDVENYYLGHCPQGITQVRRFQKIIYKNLYPNIDVIFYGKDQNIKYDVVVKPEGRPGDFQIKYTGGDLRLDPQQGTARLEHDEGFLVEGKPMAYQMAESGQVSTSAIYQLSEAGVLSFAIGEYNVQTTLVIDPDLFWSSYYGGSGIEQARGIVAANADEIYLGGFTQSANNIGSGGTHQPNLTGGEDAFIAKFNADGQRQWATYFGGDNNDNGQGIAVDNTGQIYLTGNTRSANGIHMNGFQPNLAGGSDAFLAKFTPDGQLVWGTYLGGTENDEALSVDVKEDQVYVAGNTLSSGSGFITLGIHQTVNAGGEDAFLARFDTDGNRIWTSYYGGTGRDEGLEVRVSPAGEVYLAGITESTGGIASSGHQNTYSGGQDAFLVKFDLNGQRQWATYYGGGDLERDVSVAVDEAGQVYLAGGTGSSNNISANGFQNTYGGGASDSFLAKFNPAGQRQWATYYGGDDTDTQNQITAFGDDVYMGGFTRSASDFVFAGYQTIYGGGGDGFLAKFNDDGTLEMSTYYGGDGNDGVYAVTVSDDNSIYIGTAIGQGSNTNVAFNGFQDAYGGATFDAGIAKISDVDPFTVTNINDSGSGSLRWAINNANKVSTLKTIEFEVGGTIILASPLPVITDPVTIDGNSAPIPITVNGNNAGAGAIGLHLSASLCTVRGLRIINFTDGIYTDMNANNFSIFNSSLDNCTNGFHIEESTGGEIEGNIIGGNTRGIFLENASGVQISENFIGVQADGATASANNTGVDIQGISSASHSISSNIIAFNQNGIIFQNSTGPIALSQNLVYCQVGPEISLENGAANLSPPTITNASTTRITGTCIGCTDGDRIEVYTNGGQSCPAGGTDAQARFYVGAATVAGSAWELDNNITPFQTSLAFGHQVTATLNQIDPSSIIINSSELASSFAVRPPVSGSECALAIPFLAGDCDVPLEVVGTADGNFLSSPNTSNCPFSNVDIWLRFTSVSPSFLVRYESTNGKIPDLAIYRGNCSNLILTNCSIDNNIPIASITQEATVGLEYFIRIGNSSDASSMEGKICIVPTPAPSNLSAITLSENQIELNWNDNSQEETGYRVERRQGQTGSFTPVADLAANTRTFQDNNLSPNVEYCYRVRAIVGLGFSPYSNIACETTTELPEAPANLQATAVSFAQINLNWQFSGNRNEIEDFRIERRDVLNANIFQEIARVSADSNTFSDLSVSANINYTYRVRAFGANGNSNYSNEASAQTPIDPNVGTPVPPFNLDASAVSEGQIDLTWEYDVDPDVIFKIFRSLGNPDNFLLHDTFISDQLIDVKTYNDTLDISANTLYYYQVRACNAGGESDFSEIDSALAVCNLEIVVIPDGGEDEGGTQAICGGKAASLIINNTIFQANYQWKKNGENIEGANFPNYLASETGLYSCEVSVGGGCSEVSLNEVLVVVLGSPDDILIDLNGDRLQASIRDADHYQWYHDYTLVPGANDDFYEPTEPGVYFVVVSFQECASTSNLFYFGVTSLGEADISKALQVSPNPGEDQVRLQLAHPQNASMQIELIDLQGQVVAVWKDQKVAFDWQRTLDTSSLPRGLFFLEIQLGELIARKKIILH